MTLFVKKREKNEGIYHSSIRPIQHVAVSTWKKGVPSNQPAFAKTIRQSWKERRKGPGLRRCSHLLAPPPRHQTARSRAHLSHPLQKARFPPRERKKFRSTCFRHLALTRRARGNNVRPRDERFDAPGRRFNDAPERAALFDYGGDVITLQLRCLPAAVYARARPFSYVPSIERAPRPLVTFALCLIKATLFNGEVRFFDFCCFWWCVLCEFFSSF